MNTLNPKRPRYDVSSSIQNPNSLPIAQAFNQSDFDSAISSLLLLPDSPSTSIGCSFDRALDQAISSASGDDDSLQDLLIGRARKLASLLHESTDRFSRKRVALYNSNSWSLPPELTINVFSMLDTKSLRQAALCCSMFHKCSMDPLCYSHIDLSTTTKRINDEVVCTMVRRSEKKLRSLKLGRITSQVVPSLTGSCLAGNLLRILHFYHLDRTSTNSLCHVLSAYPNLTDLKIVNFDKKHFLEKVVKSLTGRHRLLEKLFLENRKEWAATGIPSSAAEAFVTSCPNLTSLTLEILLCDLGNSNRENSPLKTLILRDCSGLNCVEVMKFLNSIITTEYYRLFRHIDVSSEHERNRIIIPKSLLTMLKEENLTVVCS